MGKFQDFTGRTFGEWTVIQRGGNKGRFPGWVCKCSCGTVKTVCANNLRSGRSTNCGCHKKEDMTGQVFGRLTVISFDAENCKKGLRWFCRCECGTVKSILRQNLIVGDIVSCGCYVREGLNAPVTHGMTGTPTYRTWAAMIKRCHGKPGNQRKYHGDMGVIVCDRWRAFENFFADMGAAPEGLSIDRWPDCNGNYEPGNVRWATAAQQQQNRRDNKLTPEIANRIRKLIADGHRNKDIAALLDVSRNAVAYIKRGGWKCD